MFASAPFTYNSQSCVKPSAVDLPFTAAEWPTSNATLIDIALPLPEIHHIGETKHTNMNVREAAIP